MGTVVCEIVQNKAIAAVPKLYIQSMALVVLQRAAEYWLLIVFEMIYNSLITLSDISLITFLQFMQGYYNHI